MPPTKPLDFNKAVNILLSPPNLDYIKTILNHVKNDPQYLFFHEMSIGLEICSPIKNSQSDSDGS